MSEQEKMDHLLHNMLAATPLPSLSPTFDTQLSKKVRRRRLTSSGRVLMAAYILLALVVSVWLMRSQSIDWSLIGISILAPVILAFGIHLGQRPHAMRRSWIQSPS